MEKFILLAARRSGTSLVIDSLNSHPFIFCEKRAFGLERAVKNPDENRHSGGFFLYRKKSLLNQIKYYIARRTLINEFLSTEVFSENFPDKAVGFRVIYGMAEKYPELARWAEENDVKVIHLIRKNVLKTHISNITAPIHKMHHPREGEKISTVRVHLDPDKLAESIRARLQEIEGQRKRYSSCSYLEVFYEDFVQSREEESKKLLKFLDVNAEVDLTSSLVKINPDSLCEVVENYQDVRQSLSGTPLEKYLY